MVVWNNVAMCDVEVTAMYVGWRDDGFQHINFVHECIIIGINT